MDHRGRVLLAAERQERPGEEARDAERIGQLRDLLDGIPSLAGECARARDRAVLVLADLTGGGGGGGLALPLAPLAPLAPWQILLAGPAGRPRHQGQDRPIIGLRSLADHAVLIDLAAHLVSREPSSPAHRRLLDIFQSVPHWVSRARQQSTCAVRGSDDAHRCARSALRVQFLLGRLSEDGWRTRLALDECEREKQLCVARTWHTFYTAALAHWSGTIQAVLQYLQAEGDKNTVGVVAEAFPCPSSAAVRILPFVPLCLLRLAGQEYCLAGRAEEELAELVLASASELDLLLKALWADLRVIG